MSDLVPIECEQVVVGEILLDHTAIGKAARLLKADHFGHPPCRAVYGACLSLWRQGVGVDLITIHNELMRSGLLDLVGGMYEVVGWTNKVGSVRHLEDHCGIVRDHYGLRILRDTGESLLTGTRPGEDPSALLGGVSDGLSKAAGVGVDGDSNAASLAMEIMDSAERPETTYLGVSSVDDLVFVLPGNMVTIRAMAGVGKTALLLSAILNLIPRHKVWFASLEMSAAELVTRALCQLALVDIDRALEGSLSDAERERMAQVAITHADTLAALDIDDASTMTVDEFSAKAEYKVKSCGATLIAVDYAQLMDADPKMYPSKVLQLEAVSKGIRATLKRLNVPGIVIVHVNKDGADHGTSQFEKDAHVRLALTREQGVPYMDVEVLKNRNGRTGAVRTPCEMRYGIVGRHGPPSWMSAAPLPVPRTTAPEQFHADNPF